MNNELDPDKLIDIAVGNIVRERREELRLTQAQLAEKIGVTFQQIQKYERGVNRMAAPRLVKAAKALNVSVSYLFGEHANEANEQAVEGMAKDYDGGQIILAWGKLSKIIRQSLAHIANESAAHG